MKLTTFPAFAHKEEIQKKLKLPIALQILGSTLAKKQKS